MLLSKNSVKTFKGEKKKKLTLKTHIYKIIYTGI